MIKNIIFVFIKIFNFTPIIHISSDKKFDTLSDPDDMINAPLRLSLLALNIGVYKLYLFTFLITLSPFKLSNPRFFETLFFDNVQCRKTVQEIDSMTKTYEKETLLKIDTDERIRQEEFLKIRTSENNDTLSNIFDKLNYYTTVILAFSAALIYVYSKLSELHLNITTLLIFYLSLINLLDIFDLILLLRRSVSISGFHRSSFKSLRLNNKNYALTKSLYFDWAASTNDVQYYAGLTKNTEIRSFRVILVGFFLIICTSITSNNVESDKNGTLLYLQSYTFLAEKGNK